jgi:prophage antirepressor-like protein
MREIFVFLFGDEGGNIPFTVMDGVVWYQAAAICRLFGYCDASSAMREHVYHLTLLDDEKIKLRVNNVNRHCDVWFITESGFWKLLAASRGFEALRIRSWLYTEVLPDILHRQLHNERAV